MGTDIAIHVQIDTRHGWKDAPDTYLRWPWPEDTPWPDDDPEERNYCVFAFLAGVCNGYRQQFKPIVSPFPVRGIPDGFDEEDLDIGEALTCTWMTVEELRQAPWDLEFDFGTRKGRPLLGTGFHNWLFGDRLSALVAEHGADNIRVVMGFD